MRPAAEGIFAADALPGLRRPVTSKQEAKNVLE